MRREARRLWYVYPCCLDVIFSVLIVFSQQNISFSSTMHDIDLAVERGMAAPPLSSEEQSKPELANLEYLISKVTEQACAESDQGGTLKQIKDFNAFLERAAVALEMKGAH